MAFSKQLCVPAIDGFVILLKHRFYVGHLKFSFPFCLAL